MKKQTAIIGISILALYLIMSTKGFASPSATKKIRGCDPFGCGEFGAGRGGREHQGEDYSVMPGEKIFSPISGKVTRFPFPYGDDLRWTGIEIKGTDYDVKIFYMKASVAVGANLNAGDVIGTAQNIASKYGTTMTNHIHVEVRDKQGKLYKLSDFI